MAIRTRERVDEEEEERQGGGGEINIVRAGNREVLKDRAGRWGGRWNTSSVSVTVWVWGTAEP